MLPTGCSWRWFSSGLRVPKCRLKRSAFPWSRLYVVLALFAVAVLLLGEFGLFAPRKRHEKRESLTQWLSAPVISDELQRPGDPTERPALQSAGQRTDFSSHDCVEGNCLIRGLCVNEARRFTYFKRQDEFPRGSGWSLGPRGPRAGAVFDPSLNLSLPSANGVEVDVVHGPVPWGYSWREGGVHVQLDRYVPGNFGHTLGDEVVALWRALEMWQLLGLPLHVYLDDLRGAENMYKLLTDVPPAPRAVAIVPGSCFEQFVIGDFRRLGYARPGDPPHAIPQLELLRFRGDVWRRFRVSGLGTREAPRHANVVLVSKDVAVAEHKFEIANLERLARQLPVVFDITARVVCWRGMPIDEQVRVMAGADVVLTAPGSDLMNAVFMPTVSAMLVPDRKVETGAQEGSNEVRLWFKFLPFRFIVCWDPWADRESVDESVGRLRLGENVVAGYLRQALRHLRSHGSIEPFVRPPRIPPRLLFVVLGGWERMLDRSRPHGLRLLQQWDPLYRQLPEYERTLLRNIQNTVDLNGAAEFTLMGTPECELAIAAADPRLLRVYNATSDLRYKSDICRLAGLYLRGGFYVDADQLSVYPWLELVEPSATFFSCVTDENGQRSRIANGILGATPRHPIIGLNMRIILSEFEKDGPSFPHGVGPRTATLAVEQARNGSEQLLVEAHLSRTDLPFHRVPPQGGQEDCQWIMFHEPSGQVVFYSRLFADGQC